MNDKKVNVLNIDTGETSDIGEKSKLIIVDSLISKTIYKMNKAGLKTRLCCVGHTDVDINNRNNHGSGNVIFDYDSSSIIFTSMFINHFNNNKLVEINYLNSVNAGVSYSGRPINGHPAVIRNSIRWDWFYKATLEDKKAFFKELNKLVNEFKKIYKE